MSEVRGIGQPVGRLEGQHKVNGTAIYTADMSLPGMLIGKLLKSPYPHARIANIDASRAEALTGVKCVVHAGTFQGPRFGPGLKDETIFPVDKIRHIGEPVAAVAAIDEDIALEALSLIDVAYEPLNPVLDPLDALDESAPLVHPELDDYVAIYPEPIKYGNVALRTVASRGSVEEGLDKADKVYYHTFKTSTTYPTPLEPHAVLVKFDGRRATVWATTQQPFFVRGALAEIFGVNLDDIHVIVPELGGGFGGKEFMQIEPYAYLLARESGRPVKMVFSREEEFTTASPRHASHVELTTGAMKDGTLIARRARIVYDTGAFAGQGPFVTACGLMSAFSTYRIPHVEGEALCVYTNKPNAASYRGYGFPQAAFACEAQMDLIAADLDIDPLDIRLKNAVVDGDPIITGQPLRAVGLSDTLERAAETADWREKRANRKPLRGIGIACGTKAAGIGASSAVVRINEDGSAMVASGVVDLGTGVNTVLAQTISEEFGIPIERVGVYTADTAAAPYDFGTVASRAVYCGVNAVKRASNNAKDKLLELAAEQMEIDAADLVLENGVVHVKGQPEAAIPLAGLGAISHFVRGGPIVGTGSFIGGLEQSMQPERLEGFPLGIMPHWAYATQVAEVEVDPVTGKVTVLRLIAAHDVGRALNPLNVEGQIEGGLVMGMSAGLFEHTVYGDDGRILNDTLVDFKLPTTMDTPELVSIIVEHEDPEGPYGAKGIGEVVSIPTPPAIANAVFNATGVMIQELPVTPEKILSALAARTS